MGHSAKTFLKDEWGVVCIVGVVFLVRGFFLLCMHSITALFALFIFLSFCLNPVVNSFDQLEVKN